jgi:hypothetical protein
VFVFAFLLCFGEETQEKPKIPPNASLFLRFQETPLHSSTLFSTKTQESRNAARIMILTSAAVFQRALVKHENKQALGREVEHSLTNLSMHGQHSQFNV